MPKKTWEYESSKRAREKYEKKNQRLTVNFRPPDADLYKYLEELGVEKSTYMKKLLRADMEKNKAAD